MIHKVTKTYYSLSCDRCGCAFENDETDDGLFEEFTITLAKKPTILIVG